MATRRSVVLSGLGALTTATLGTGTNGAKDAGIFRKEGIDLEVDVRPFARRPAQ